MAGRVAHSEELFSVHNNEGVICMGHNELLDTVTELCSLRNLADELHDQILALEDIIKNEMNSQGVDKLYLGDCKVSWLEYSTSRFDTKKFKAEHEAVYKQYTTTIKARQFTIS